MTPEVPLAGGNMGTVVRVGDTVRRQVGEWSAAVHELLLHLEAVGYDHAPRFLGLDESGREVLSFIEGETVGDTLPWPAWAWDDGTLVQVAEVLRRYHDAVASFRPAGARVWRFSTGTLQPHEVVCHNDIAPYNIVVRDGRVVALIDWDLAGPGLAVTDVAFAAWTFAPVTTTDHASELGAPPDALRRVRLLCDIYGIDQRAHFIDQLEMRMAASIAAVEARAARGEAAFVGLVRRGHLDRMKADAERFAVIKETWRDEI
jgi:hypothetical protein